MRKGWTVTMLAALVVVLASGCQFAVVGDSVVSISRNELGAEGGWTLANGGVDIATGREALQYLAEYGDEPIVISLGLMDTSLRSTPEDIERRIRNVLEQDVADVDCVIWVDLKVTSGIHDHWPARSRTFNRILYDVAAEHDRPVARWSEASAGHPDWFQDDGVHPNLLGQQKYAAFLADAVEQHC